MKVPPLVPESYEALMGPAGVAKAMNENAHAEAGVKSGVEAVFALFVSEAAFWAVDDSKISVRAAFWSLVKTEGVRPAHLDCSG